MAKDFWLRFELGEWFSIVMGCNADDHSYVELADIANRKPRLRRELKGGDIKRLHGRIKMKSIRHEQIISQDHEGDQLPNHNRLRHKTRLSAVLRMRTQSIA